MGGVGRGGAQRSGSAWGVVLVVWVLCAVERGWGGIVIRAVAERSSIEGEVWGLGRLEAAGMPRAYRARHGAEQRCGAGRWGLVWGGCGAEAGDGKVTRRVVWAWYCPRGLAQ